MSWAAVAVVGAAVVGGVASNRASKRASEGQSDALQASSASVEAAKFDINRLFGQAKETREGGFGRTLDFLAGAPGRQIDPFQQGSLAAQETTAAGLPQVQRAILGLPTDLSQIRPRTIEGNFNVDASEFRPPPAASTPTPGVFNPPPIDGPRGRIAQPSAAIPRMQRTGFQIPRFQRLPFLESDFTSSR